MDDTKINNDKLLPIILFSSIFVLFAPVFYKFFMWWESDPNYNHGILVPLVSIYLIWKKRDAIKIIESESSWIGIIFIALGIFCYFFGVRLEFMRLSFFSFLFFIIGILIYCYGFQITNEYIFPICFLLLVIPIPYLDSLTVPLKLFATSASVGFIRFIGIPVIREGNLIHLKELTLEVDTACSGLKSLVLVTTIGILYSYLTQTKSIKRLSISLLSILIAVVANISRIILTAILASTFNKDIAFKFTHDFSGIFVFIIAGAMLVVVGEGINWIFQEKTIGY